MNKKRRGASQGTPAKQRPDEREKVLRPHIKKTEPKKPAPVRRAPAKETPARTGKTVRADRRTSPDTISRKAPSPGKIPASTAVSAENAAKRAPTDRPAKNPAPAKGRRVSAGGKTVRVVFLGGVGEIGKNMTALEYGEDIVVIDCGRAFPTEDTPGMDVVVVPDVSYLSQNRSKIRGLFLTHGHEDHVGGLPYVWGEMGFPPVYGTAYTLAIARHKITENKIPENGLFHEVKNGDRVKAGSFSVEFVKVCHSMAQASALSVSTPVGTVFATGDFKIDYTPIDGKLTDLERIGEIGRKGVLLMLCESTNVERPGLSMSERKVGESFDEIFGQHDKKRLVVATFSTNNYRIQQLLDCSMKYERKVVLSGRSMKKTVEIATALGELKYPKDLIIDIDKANKYPPERVTILCTGSQGEPMSALARMSMGEFNKVTIGATDTVVISAMPIPGNERGVNNVINNLYRLGAEVIYDAAEEIHASGHACREELKLMMSLVRPKFFIPVHGEYRHLMKNAGVAESMGIPAASIFVPEIGNAVCVSRGRMTRVRNVPAGNNFIDGVALGGAAQSIFRDRKSLSEGGFIAVVAAVRPDGQITFGPCTVSRGVRLPDDFREKAKKIATEAMAAARSPESDYCGDPRTAVRKALGKYVASTTGQTPLILPVITEA